MLKIFFNLYICILLESFSLRVAIFKFIINLSYKIISRFMETHLGTKCFLQNGTEPIEKKHPYYDCDDVPRWGQIIEIASMSAEQSINGK